MKNSILKITVLVALFISCKKEETLYTGTLEDLITEPIMNRADSFAKSKGLIARFDWGILNGKYIIIFDIDKRSITKPGPADLKKYQENYIDPLDIEATAYIFKGKNPKDLNCESILYLVYYANDYVRIYHLFT